MAVSMAWRSTSSRLGTVVENCGLQVCFTKMSLERITSPSHKITATKKLDADAKEFQRKLENNGFATRERAEQEQMRLMKQQQELQALQQKLSDELASENQKNSLQLRDSINSFLKIYNQNKGYDLIISNTGFDNLLYANPAYNITQEIIDGLNARYTPSSVKK